MSLNGRVVARLCMVAIVVCLAAEQVRAQAAPEPGATQEPLTLGQALKGGDVLVGLRYRFEHVDEEALVRSASASTLRASLGYRTRPFHGVDALLELSTVADVGAGALHNDAGAGTLGNGITDRPVIADPSLTRVHQALGTVERWDTRVSAGRMELALDDERFVGPVKWRQSYQSFLAARLENRSIARTVLSYAYLDRAYTVTGGERPLAGHLVNAAVAVPIGTVVAYTYLLDFENEQDAGASTRTIGARLSGQRPAGRLSVGYEAAFARQWDHGSNPGRVRAGYLRGQVALGVPKIAVEVSYEELGGSEGDGRFTTPLATLHAFNGWADKFLATPPLGLRDASVGLKGAAGRVSWRAAFHQFDADSGGAAYGREVDLLLSYKTPWKQVWAAKAALYDAQGLSTDTTKVWVWSAYSF